ncbi:MAG: glycogen/starch/alpha-glucan phosphorylase [Erysipelothrix sp.]|nr:glycogen/starch/alpha-glucan phosphorylase [Erysipelothrix sp.]
MKKGLLEYTNNDLENASVETVYNAVLKLTQNKIKETPHVSGERKVYYMSAEFLIGKLLTNNLMNLGIYDEVKDILASHGRSISEIEDFDPEPSLGNGGLGRLAACFLDSIATLGINGEGLGLSYHYGLFKQVFKDHQQTEEKDVWLDKPSWLRPTEHTYPVTIGDTKLQSRMYEIDVLGYNKEKTTLRLFDLESLDEKLVEKGIEFDQEAIDKNLTLFLYPDDSTEKGLRLRFAQQYFMVESGIQYIIETHKEHLDELDKHIVIQINDTHPAMAVLLLIKKLLEHDISFEKAVSIVSSVFAYTNHTILAEALEKWPLAYFEAVDSEMLSILMKLDEVVKKRSTNPNVQLIDKDNLVHMAALSIHFSFSVNGVAALHTDILVNSELKDYADMYPGKFNNKTNGITFRRWLQFSNPSLSQYIEDKIGDGFKKDATELVKLESFINDETVLHDIMDIKQAQKERLKDFLLLSDNVSLDTNSILDIQIKRLHEYKRQQLNLLYIIYMVQKIEKGYKPKRPVTFIFGSKAAPAYTIAKDIIHALLTLSTIIEKDALLSQYIHIIFVENYNVTKAEYLIPACDVSEQISLASKEASGTGNMKLMLNGAITLGTLDGANVEIKDHVGDDNIYIFGEDSDTIITHYENADYVSRDYYNSIPELKDAVDYLVSETMLAEGNKVNLERLYNELLNKDWFMTFIDFEDYVKVKDQMFEDYEDKLKWAKMSLMNIANAGFFSSDRTIADYNKDIWKV